MYYFPMTRKLAFVILGTPQYPIGYPCFLETPTPQNLRDLHTSPSLHHRPKAKKPYSLSVSRYHVSASQYYPNDIMGKGCHVFYQSQTVFCPGMAPVPDLQLLAGIGYLKDQECSRCSFGHCQHYSTIETTETKGRNKPVNPKPHCLPSMHTL